MSHDTALVVNPVPLSADELGALAVISQGAFSLRHANILNGYCATTQNMLAAADILMDARLIVPDEQHPYWYHLTQHAIFRALATVQAQEEDAA